MRIHTVRCVICHPVSLAWSGCSCVFPELRLSWVLYKRLLASLPEHKTISAQHALCGCAAEVGVCGTALCEPQAHEAIR